MIITTDVPPRKEATALWPLIVHIRRGRVHGWVIQLVSVLGNIAVPALKKYIPRRTKNDTFGFMLTLDKSHPVCEQQKKVHITSTYNKRENQALSSREERSCMFVPGCLKVVGFVNIVLDVLAVLFLSRTLGDLYAQDSTIRVAYVLRKKGSSV